VFHDECVKTAALAVLTGALLVCSSAQASARPKWTLAQARAVLTNQDFFVTDVRQADRPDYDLAFSRRSAKSLSRRFAFDGLAHDRLTDTDVRGDCAAQPAAWHQYSGDRAEYMLPPDAYMISPGFEEMQEALPRLPRDPERWRQSVAHMVASQVHWQLVISFNEWPEGTSVESAREWASSSGYGAYLDVLHELVPARSQAVAAATSRPSSIPR
jgi:hypothetical protein